MNAFMTSGAWAIVLAACALALKAQAQTPPAASPQTAAQTAAPAPRKDFAASAGLMVNPSKGQSADQEAQDEAQCFSWARDQSGYDPMNPPPAPSAPLASTGHSDDVVRDALGGTAVGAAGGALIGAIAGNAAKGAGIGAAAGLLAGGIRAHERDEARAKAQARLDEQHAARQELTQQFRRAMSVCLEARGYESK